MYLTQHISERKKLRRQKNKKLLSLFKGSKIEIKRLETV